MSLSKETTWSLKITFFMMALALTLIKTDMNIPSQALSSSKRAQLSMCYQSFAIIARPPSQETTPSGHATLVGKIVVHRSYFLIGVLPASLYLLFLGLCNILSHIYPTRRAVFLLRIYLFEQRSLVPLCRLLFNISAQFCREGAW